VDFVPSSLQAYQSTNSTATLGKLPNDVGWNFEGWMEFISILS